MRTIEIIVTAKGETSVQTKGFSGASCRDASRFIEQALTQRSLIRAVADITGESLATIAHLGFSPLTRGPIEREPLAVDWDDLDALRYRVLPQRQRSRAGSE